MYMKMYYVEVIFSTNKKRENLQNFQFLLHTHQLGNLE